MFRQAGAKEGIEKLSRRVIDAMSQPAALYALIETSANGAVASDGAAKGTLTVTPGGYGPTLAVSGVELSYINQLVFDPFEDQEPLARVVLEPGGGLTIRLHKDPRIARTHPRGIHRSGDAVFSFPTDPETASQTAP